MELKNLFETFNNGRKMITTRLKNYKMYSKFNDEVIENLLRNHPTKKISNIEYLIIKPHEIYRSRTLYFKQPNQDEDNVSYKLCIQNIFGQYSTDKNTKANKIPATIICPKSITGLMSLTAKEAKAIMVVKAV